MTEHKLADKIGPQLLAVRLSGQLLGLDQVGSVRVRHGRQDVTQPVEAATATLTVNAAHLARLPVVGDALLVELGADVVTWAQLDAAGATAARVRFAGDVTDVRAAPDRKGTPARVTVTATSRRARLGRTFVGDAPWPVELDGARAERVLALAAPVVGSVLGPIDPGTVTVTARDVDKQPALDLLDTLAAHTGGQLVELRSGELRWHDALHRRRAAVDAELTAAQVLADVSSQQKLGGIVNELTVTYGPAVEGGERPSTSYSDPTSVASHGPFGATLSSQLQELADAQAFARLTVGRRSLPRWELDELRVELTRTVPPATAGRLLRLEHADLLRVVGFPASGPFSAARLWVEGWTETITPTSWAMTLHVSDYGRSAPEPRWVDVNPEVSWADSSPVTWLQAVGWDSGPGRGDRWVDVPADARWVDVPLASTWADYSTTGA